MSGRKHWFWQNGTIPTHKGTDEIERSLYLESQVYHVPIYCSFCGKEILKAAKDEYNHSYDYESDLAMGAHKKCLEERFRR